MPSMRDGMLLVQHVGNWSSCTWSAQWRPVPSVWILDESCPYTASYSVWGPGRGLILEVLF